MRLFFTIKFLFLSVALTCYATEQKIINNIDGSEMMLIPGGTFNMGCPVQSDCPSNEKPMHSVYIVPFYISKYEVTNEMFARFLNAQLKTDEFEKKRKNWVVTRDDLKKEDRADWWPTEIILKKGKYSAVSGFEKYPVITASWYAADAYCKWIGGRLPTEAEWEKAARGGLEGKDYPWGNQLPTDGIVFNRIWKYNSLPAPTERIGNYYPNGYGLYDMAGNVSEWCSDWFDENYYSHSPSKNPKGPETGVLKVIRGGSWINSREALRVTQRNNSLPENLNSGVGFRCAMDYVK